jgi:hypothetical protein
MPLPAKDLRSNYGTWSIPTCKLPGLGVDMITALPFEKFDPLFRGQYLETTYFDTKNQQLRKARLKKDRYLTIRIRCYSPPYSPGSSRQTSQESYAISAKTESEKFRQVIDSTFAEQLLADGITTATAAMILPANLVSRLIELADTDLSPYITVCFQRYAVEDDKDRLTLDTDITTDTGKSFPCSVLEYKSTKAGGNPPIPIFYKTIRLSKFLWASSF